MVRERMRPTGRLAAWLLLLVACRSQDGAVSLISATAQTPSRTSALDSSRRTAIVDAAARVGPAVVSINATTRRRVASNDPFDFFFVPRTSEQLVPVGGTGFIVRQDGIILPTSMWWPAR